ncbi:MAG: hypothetical protein WD738_12110 [Pirellulales bacterium]
MENAGPLFWYGLFVLILTGSLILIPYIWRGTSLLSGWNMMLVGLASFTGLGCLEAFTSPIIRFHGLDWFQPTKAEVTWFMSATTLFLAALIGTYYYNPFKRLTDRTLNKWPPQSTALYLWVIGGCLIVIVLAPLTMNSVFIGRVTLQLSHKAIVFATVFSFLLWMRQKMNPAWLALFIGTFLAALMLAMLAGATRRLFLSVFLGPVVVVYMTYVRHWRPSRALIALGLAAVTLLSINFIYNSFRRIGMHAGARERTAATLLEGARNVDTTWLQKLSSDTFRMMAQSNVQYALFTKRNVDTGRLEAKTLNTVLFVLSYPIPRAIWPEKPSVIGLVITHDVVGARRANWGVNVIGHAAYEGGLWVAGLYGFLAAVGLRFLDDPFLRQPTNPFLMSAFAAAGPHIVGWPRGDIGVMSTEVLECFLFVFAIGIGARLFFGTDKTTQTSRVAIPRARPFQQSLAR